MIILFSHCIFYSCKYEEIGGTLEDRRAHFGTESNNHENQGNLYEIHYGLNNPKKYYRLTLTNRFVCNKIKALRITLLQMAGQSRKCLD